MKRFLLASVIAMTVTVMPTVVFADDTAPTVAAPTPPAAPTVAPVAAPVVAPVAPPAAVKAAPPVVTTTGATVAAKPAAAPVPAPVAPPAAAPAPAAPPAAAPAAVAPAAVAPVAAPAAAPAAAGAPDATPLALHVPAAAKPLALAPQSEGLGMGYKILAVLAIGGAVALYLKKKRGPKVEGIVPAKIDILARSGIGVRSQLVVVEVEGTRLLVGMTPSAIQTLAVLQTPEDDNVAAEARAAAIEDRLEQERDAREVVLRPANIGDRFRSLLGADEPIAPPAPRLSAVKPTSKAPKARSAPRAVSAARKPSEAPSREIAGQARGLLLSVDEDT